MLLSGSVSGVRPPGTGSGRALFHPHFRYPQSTRAVGLPGPLVTRDDMKPQVVYQMLKIVYSRMGELQKMNGGFKGESPATGLRGQAIPVHAGAEQFFRNLARKSSGKEAQCASRT
jgi:hypothetical protein